MSARAAIPETRAQGAPEISVVVPAKNRPESLARLVDSVARQRGVSTEVVIVDDGSSTPLAVAGHDVTIVRHDVSRGACASRNAGVASARGEFVAFFDDDAELELEDVLARAMAWLRARPSAGAVAFRQTEPGGRTRGVNPSTSDAACLAPVFYTYGCLLRRSVLDEVGGFAEPFHYYFEEVELGLRVLDAGYEIVYDPTLSVVHHESQTGRDWLRISRLTLRNSLLTVLLLYPFPLIGVGMARAIYNGHRGFVTRVGPDVGGKARAVLELSRHWRYVLERRHPIRARTLLRFRALGARPERI